MNQKLSKENKINRLAIFDFCETLVSIQSADSFIDFVREKSPNSRSKFLEWIRVLLIRIYFFRLLNILIPGNLIHKKLKLYQLKGFHRKELISIAEDYALKIQKNFLISDMLKILTEKKNDNFRIIILSGGLHHIS